MISMRKDDTPVLDGCGIKLESGRLRQPCRSILIDKEKQRT